MGPKHDCDCADDTHTITTEVAEHCAILHTAAAMAVNIADVGQPHGAASADGLGAASADGLGAAGRALD